MALLRGLLLAALLVAVRARETLLYDSEHKTPVKLRFVGGPETQSSVRPRSGKSGEQLAALRLLPKDLSNVRLSEPKSRKFMIHEALANSSAQGRLALVPADNSVISSDVDLHKILQRTTMKMRPYPTTTPETPTEVPSEHSENEIIEEPLNLSPAAAVQQQPPEPPKQLPPARPSLPRASQLPAAVPMASALTPPPPSFAAEATPSGDKEPLGCGWDILSNSCKDLFGLGWCLECRDFGNIFFHDCKCAMRAPSVPSVAPQNPQPTPFPLVAPQPQMAVPQLPQVPQIPQIPQVPQVPQFPQIPQTPSVGVLPPAPQQLFILRT